MDKLYDLLMKVPKKESLLMGVAMGFGGGGSNSGFIRITLVDRDKRNRSQQKYSRI